MKLFRVWFNCYREQIMLSKHRVKIQINSYVHMHVQSSTIRLERKTKKKDMKWKLISNRLRSYLK